MEWIAIHQDVIPQGSDEGWTYVGTPNGSLLINKEVSQ
jgi:hypothetical protein